jgi:hypothetical protein
MLRERIDAVRAMRDRIEAVDLRLNVKIDGETVRLNQRYEMQKEAISSALAAAEKAVEVANVANEKRLDAVNEFRAQQADIIRSFLSRDEYNAAHSALVEKTESLAASNMERISAVSSRLDRLEAGGVAVAGAHTEQRAEHGAQGLDDYYRSTQSRAQVGWVFAGLASLISIVSIILVVVLHK